MLPKVRWQIELGDGTFIPVLHDDRATIAIDKPAGWLLAPSDWDRTSRNLQRALESCINGSAHWARVRRIRFLRFVHRLDAETSGIVLMVKSAGAVKAYSKLFEERQVQKAYLAVVSGSPTRSSWTCKLALRPDSSARGRVKTIPTRTLHGEAKEAITHFRTLKARSGRALVLAEPITGRTHQIRVHLTESGHPVLDDALYGGSVRAENTDLALRAIKLQYGDPFTGRSVVIEAPWEEFAAKYGFELSRDELYEGLDRQKIGSDQL